MLQSLFQRKKKSENNKILEFKEGFLVKANKTGRSVVLDCINEANATLGERLNSLLDKKNNEEETYFDIPQNTEELQIKIYKWDKIKYINLFIMISNNKNKKHLLLKIEIKKLFMNIIKIFKFFTPKVFFYSK